jgi:hypothetical protein
VKANGGAGPELRSFTGGGAEVEVDRIIRLPDLGPSDLEVVALVCGDPCTWPRMCRDCDASTAGEAMIWLRDLAERITWMDVFITERSDETMGGVPR